MMPRKKLYAWLVMGVIYGAWWVWLSQPELVRAVWGSPSSGAAAASSR